MKRVVLLGLCVVVAGCNKKSGPEAATAKGPKVAFLLSTLQEERYKKDQQYFEAAAQRLGLNAFTLAADNDNARQLAQVEDALSRGAKVLVIQPTDSAAASSYVGKAHAAGAKVVAYDRNISGDADFYVAHDSHRVGVLSAEAAVKATNGKGNYVLLQGQSGHSVATEIARGYMDVLKPYVERGDIKIVVEKSHDAWSPEQSLKTVEDALQKSGGKLDAILANNSGMARGAVQAIEAARLARPVFIAGADADAANVNYICAGKQSVEVLKDIQPLAEKAAEVAAGLLGVQAQPTAAPIAGGKTPMAAVPVHLVTSQTVDALIVKSGFHPQAALPSCKL